MLERDFLFFFVTPLGLYVVASLVLCYRLHRRTSWTIGSALLLGLALLVGFAMLVTILGVLFMFYHPMDPPGT